MTSTINATTTGGGGVVTTADASGNLALQGAGVTQITVSSTGVTLANALPVAQGGTGVTTSTGSGANVLSTNPVLVTPSIGAATATTVNNVTITNPGTTATLTLANGSTFATSGAFSQTFTATGTTSLTLPTSGTITALGNAVVGSGSIVLATSPTLTTPSIGAATATTVNNITITNPGTTATLTLANGSTFSTAGSVTHAGAFLQTFTASAATSLNLPTSGTIISTVTNMAANPVTGTPSSTTFLRGDGTWATPAGGGTVTSVAQTFTGGLISVSGSPVTSAGTLALTVAGTSGGVPYFNSGTTWLSSAALAANAIVIGGGAGAAPATVTTNSTVLTALGAAPQGSGSIVLATSPTLTTPTIGAASATTINNVTITNPGTTAVLTLANASTLSTAGSVTHAGAFSQTFTATATTNATLPAGTVTLAALGTAQTWTATQTFTSPVIGTIVNTGTLTLPTSTDTLVGRATTDTLTNKRITPRVNASTANVATPTLNTDNYDMMVITGQSTAITSFTTNLTGTPTNGQKLWISITGTTAIAITWGASFESSTVTLPTTTVTTARLDVGFVWNAATSAWRCVAVA